MDAVTGRAQLVVVAGAVVAVALIPVVVAAFQVGGGPAPDPPEHRVRAVERTLETGVRTVAGTTRAYAWEERVEASRALRSALAPTIAAMETGAAGAVVNVTYAPATARDLAARRCPRGPNRQFGPCAAVGGVILQERVGEPHVVAVVVRVVVLGPTGRTAVTLVVEPGVRIDDG